MLCWTFCIFAGAQKKVSEGGVESWFMVGALNLVVVVVSEVSLPFVTSQNGFFRLWVLFVL